MSIFTNAAEKFAVPEEVSGWLGRLVLLYGIPFHYLIPEEQMLPPESIRFFYVDPIWIQCLVQGACSVGNTDYGSRLIDSALNTLLQPNVPENSTPNDTPSKPVTGRAAATVRDRLREQYEGVRMPSEAEDLDLDLHWPLTGFLLRSAAVKGWRGLEVMAYKKLDKDSVAPLNTLRIEQLASDVMLGLFNGVIGQLVIRQPQEGLHFGLTRGSDSCSRTLRAMRDHAPVKAGDTLTEVAVLMRANGVIQIADLAEKIKKQLPKDQLEKGKFTSAEFAVEMIEAPGEFTFQLV